MDVFRDPGATPQALLAAVKALPGMASVYETQVRHYVLEEHTRLVLGQFDWYFGNLDLPMPRELFRFLLTVHDIGKPQAQKEGGLRNQHRYTARMINEMRGEIPFSNPDIDCCLAIVGGDPLGQYMQGKAGLVETTESIMRAAGMTVVSIQGFFKALTIYYQCDVAAYTKDAGGLPFLEKVFVYRHGSKVVDEKRGILMFSRTFEDNFKQLEKAFA